MTDQKSIDAMPFEAAMAELEDIVNRLESGSVPLDESIKLFEYGSRLKKRCESTLEAAQEKIQTIMLDASGKPTGVNSDPL